MAWAEDLSGGKTAVAVASVGETAGESTGEATGQGAGLGTDRGREREGWAKAQAQGKGRTVEAAWGEVSWAVGQKQHRREESLLSTMI